MENSNEKTYIAPKLYSGHELFSDHIDDAYYSLLVGGYHAR